MVRVIAILAALIALSGCATLAGVAGYGPAAEAAHSMARQTAADAAREIFESAQWRLCAAPLGTVLAVYGSEPRRINAWATLCGFDWLAK